MNPLGQHLRRLHRLSAQATRLGHLAWAAALYQRMLRERDAERFRMWKEKRGRF